MDVESFIQHALIGDVVEAYDLLDELLAAVEKHAPQYWGRIETARNLVFSVRVELEAVEGE